ncbi:replication protein [uncultured Tissierella sp.]|uniref:replication protein n=1 Tax=uncultured Tissierella sp. TaxID=448160 RepID=UPI0028050E70|nr:replication protein [uncultured Tissierella sp.]MDU5081233.1 replication protein [Bacillota bacterium]
MSSPQLENGFTRIANEILEAMARVKLSPTQYRIIFTVWRYTYGFQRKSHQLSLTFLTEATGCDFRLIQREVKKLIDMKILLSNQTKGKTREIGFNKDLKDWRIDIVQNTIGEIDNGNLDNGETDNIAIGETDNIAIGEIDNETIGEMDNQERKKEKSKETVNDYKSIFDFYFTLNLIKHRSYTNDMAKAIKKAIKDNGYDIKYCKELLRRHAIVVEKTKSSQYPVKSRGFAEFFGQKVYGGTHLICSEYEEGGKYYEQYFQNEKEDSRIGIPPSESILGEREEPWM